MADFSKVKIRILNGPFSALPYGEEEIEREVKISKAEAGYMAKPEGGFRCDNCVFFIGEPKKEGRCTKVHGPIRPQDCCNKFESPGELGQEEYKEQKEEEKDAGSL